MRPHGKTSAGLATSKISMMDASATRASYAQHPRATPKLAAGWEHMKLAKTTELSSMDPQQNTTMSRRQWRLSRFCDSIFLGLTTDARSKQPRITAHYEHLGIGYECVGDHSWIAPRAQRKEGSAEHAARAISGQETNAQIESANGQIRPNAADEEYQPTDQAAQQTPRRAGTVGRRTSRWKTEEKEAGRSSEQRRPSHGDAAPQPSRDNGRRLPSLTVHQDSFIPNNATFLWPGL